MSVSTSNVQVQNITLTPMRVSANGVDLGGTVGGVTLSIKTDLSDITVDQFGKTVLDSRVSGHHFGLKFELAESLDPTKWKIAFPHSKLVGSPGNQSILFDMQIGDSLKGHAVQWKLHPLDKADNDLSDDILLYSAAAKSASEIKYGPDKQTGVACEVTVFPDSSVSPQRFMLHGDPANGATNAAAAAAVAGGSNTGNGTITSPAANNAKTVTETITVACIGIGASSATEMRVSGSVSGILGVIGLAAASGSSSNFTPASPTPAVVSFTITQGTTPFAVGDSFTIAMTAANYS